MHGDQVPAAVVAVSDNRFVGAGDSGEFPHAVITIAPGPIQRISEGFRAAPWACRCKTAFSVKIRNPRDVSQCVILGACLTEAVQADAINLAPGIVAEMKGGTAGTCRRYHFSPLVVGQRALPPSGAVTPVMSPARSVCTVVAWPNGVVSGKAAGLRCHRRSAIAFSPGLEKCESPCAVVGHSHCPVIRSRNAGEAPTAS